ncbi:MAG: hypothetical protein WCJ64_26370 [Rhodospirillaceae bacterium]
MSKPIYRLIKKGAIEIIEEKVDDKEREAVGYLANKSGVASEKLMIEALSGKKKCIKLTFASQDNPSIMMMDDHYKLQGLRLIFMPLQKALLGFVSIKSGDVIRKTVAGLGVVFAVPSNDVECLKSVADII